jgi:hypothetical protein
VRDLAKRYGCELRCRSPEFGVYVLFNGDGGLFTDGTLSGLMVDAQKISDLAQIYKITETEMTSIVEIGRVVPLAS